MESERKSIRTERGNRQESQEIKKRQFKMKQKHMKILTFLSALYIISQASHSSSLRGGQQIGPEVQAKPNFPGVSRELASFCSARPSLQIDLASMIVHVKRNSSFNYKLYLFSPDYVFQTGQVIPRDDFRIHSFPVRLKRLVDFWPQNVTTFAYKSSKADSLERVQSDSFKLKHFLRPVNLDPSSVRDSSSRAAKRVRKLRVPEDAHGEALPGDPAGGKEENFNRHIHFDRDDEVSVSRRSIYAERHFMDSPEADLRELQADGVERRKFSSELVVPVGSFSSFNLDTTYLVRKDFDQIEPQVIRIKVEPSQFKVVSLELISNGTQASFPINEDYSFLSHKLLRDPNTRITAVNQIYEDWITRNFYTVVYIQRKLSESHQEDLSVTVSNGEEEEEGRRSSIVDDRLVFRGSSSSLLGAEQLEYSVKAAAFITEKNGLHYYLEFLPSGKFYLGAIDWSTRPFKIMDSRRYPIKATKTLLDNEELLLCPPAVCYSSQPVDEVVSFGRLQLAGKVQRQAAILSSSSSSSAQSASSSASNWRPVSPNTKPLSEAPQMNLSIASNETSITRGQGQSFDLTRDSREVAEVASTSNENDDIDLDKVIDQVKLASLGLQTRLHLRDWVWLLRSVKAKARGQATPHARFELRYELARRNDIKPKPDNYGYVLTGHEIGASYRVYNELYLISDNHLITINYTIQDQTSVSSHPISEQFFGLESSLLEPITAAFYDRYNNQLYFFKGDRYIGYDYATRKPLDEFVLQEINANVANLQMESATQDQTSIYAPIVSSLPVIDILGRQHQVDSIYHDLSSDLVYIFTGMKFYSFMASEFKNGTFRQESRSLPKMHCLNENFLHGCNFDDAFPNPCQDEEVSAQIQVSKSIDNVVAKLNFINDNRLNFSEEQQMKLRSIANRAGLANFLVETSILSDDRAKVIATGANSEYKPQDRIVFYLLTAMLSLTVLLIVVMLVVLINWTKIRFFGEEQEHKQARKESNQISDSRVHHYMSNQQHYSRRIRQSTNSPRVGTKSLASSKGAVVSKSGRRHGEVTDNSAL